MDNCINQITTSFLVEEILDAPDSKFARPILTGYILSGEKINPSPVKVIFSENTEARKIKGVKKGDILFVYGNLGYTLKEMIIIYAKSFLIISKNEANISPNERKIIFTSYSHLPNQIILQGTITNIFEDENKLLIDVKRNELVRGEIKKYDLLPVEMTNHPYGLKNKDDIVIIGSIKGNSLYGMVKKILN